MANYTVDEFIIQLGFNENVSKTSSASKVEH